MGPQKLKETKEKERGGEGKKEEGRKGRKETTKFLLSSYMRGSIKNIISNMHVDLVWFLKLET